MATYFALLQAMDGKEITHRFLVPAHEVGEMNAWPGVQTFSSRRRGGAAFWSMILATLKAYDEVRPDLVYFHSTFSLLALAALRLLRRGARTLYCAHGWGVNRFGQGTLLRWLAARVEGRGTGFAHGVVCISENELRVARALKYRGKFEVVEHGVPEARSHGRSDQRDLDEIITLLFVGRLDHEKGVDSLLAAFEKVQSVRSDLVLRLVGSGFRNKDAVLIPEGVEAVGWVSRDKIDEHYAAADALVVPSRWEGFGLIVPEAYRNGTPVLTSNVGALPDLVEVGKTGFVYDGSSSQLADILQGLDKSQLVAMRPACRQAYEDRFTVERFHREMAALFTSVVARGR